MKRQLVKELMMEGKPLKVALEAVGMAKSSYYYRAGRRRQPRALDESLVRSISEVRQGYAGVYGYRKVTMALRAAGCKVNAKKVLRHLRALGLTQPRKLKGRKWSRPAIVKPAVCNTYWEADFTYVWTGSTNAYLCVVIDAWDRDIVGDVFSDRCRAREAVEALERAVLSRFGGRVPYSHELTLRVDRGPQFTACSFREAARILNVRLEYAGIQCPEDKPYIESFFGSYKTEELYRNEYNSLAEARTRWESYRAWYRNYRLHQGLRYRSPREYANITHQCKLLVA
jgi:transposase InsO family protein|tara:strand:- start:28 stop:882 length:855 start_codon:yes stop_codon:yes gene_type:complete